MKTYKVIQYGSGATGKFALSSVLTHPALELVGLGVHSERNAGRDAGAICRLPDTGVLATRDIDRLLVLDADCVVFMPWDPHAGDVLENGSHSAGLFDLLCRFLASGKNVIASAPNSLVYVPSLGGAAVANLKAACATGNSSFLYTGVSPGFMPDRLVLNLTAISSRIDSITVREIMNYANYDGRDTIMGLYGFGQHPANFDRTQLVASFARTLGGSVAMIADGLALGLDEIVTTIDFAPATEAFDIATGRIEQGTIAAERIRASGMVESEARIVAEHVTRVSHAAALDWPRFGDGEQEGYQVEIVGAPSMKVEFELGAFGRNPMADAGWAVGGHMVNSIADLCDAPAGIRTFIDMPAARGQYRMNVRRDFV
jgi:4-hydroxy-tetrahydrodipicolinate reductase